jgi:hypothetical protein
MIPKSGHRFSEQIMRKKAHSQKPRRQKPDLRQINPAVENRAHHDQARRTKNLLGSLPAK